MRILLVDDNVATLDSLYTLLEKHGHIVHTATTASGALITAKEAPVDVVVLDYVLPDRDGSQFIADFRLSEQKVPIIVLTALPAMEITEVATRLTEYKNIVLVQKPVEVKNLLDLLDAMTKG